MSGLGPVMLMVLAAANPAAGALSVAWRPSNRDQWRPRVALAVLAAVGALWVIAALADPILDGLSVTTGTWRLATAVPFAVAGLWWMVWPDHPVHDEPRAGTQVALIALTVLFTPQLVAVVLATAAHDGTLRTMAGVVLAARHHRRPALVPSRPHPPALDHRPPPRRHRHSPRHRPRSRRHPDPLDASTGHLSFGESLGDRRTGSRLGLPVLGPRRG